MRKKFLKFAALLMGTAILFSGWGMQPVQAKSVRSGHVDENGVYVDDHWTISHDKDTFKSYIENTETGERLGPGWHQYNGSDYFIEDDGYISESLVIGGRLNGIRVFSYLDEKGEEQIEAYKSPFTWKSDATGTYYEDANGYKLRVSHDYKYDYMNFVIDGTTYMFNKAGYLIKDKWIEEEYQGTSISYTNWIYVDKDGKRAFDWKQIDGDWYYFGDYGYLRYNCVSYLGEEGSKQYYAFDTSGKLVTYGGWFECKNMDGGALDYWYYLDENGKPYKGWQQIDGEWYFFNADCNMENYGARDCSSDHSGDYYVFKEDGTLASEGWYGVKNVRGDGEFKWYYVDSNSKPCTGWKPIDGTWYYFAKNGAMRTDAWQDGYYLGGDGAMYNDLTGSWYQDDKGWYFMDSNGWYPQNTSYVIDNVTYEFDGDGYLIEE